MVVHYVCLCDDDMPCDASCPLRNRNLDLADAQMREADFSVENLDFEIFRHVLQATVL